MEETLKSTLYAAIAMVAAVGITPAFAYESTSRCYMSRGHYICDRTTESAGTTTSTRCISGVRSSGCTTTTEPTKIPLTHGAVPSCQFEYGRTCD
jgi:hypothetical protein